MSLWADYMKERLGHHTIETEDGFVVFDVKPPKMSIEDIYVRPEVRKGTKSLKLFNEAVARGKAQGCTEVWTQVWIGPTGAERALRVNLALGFRVMSAQNNGIILMKEIGG